MLKEQMELKVQMVPKVLMVILEVIHLIILLNQTQIHLTQVLVKLN